MKTASSEAPTPRAIGIAAAMRGYLDPAALWDAAERFGRTGFVGAAAELFTDVLGGRQIESSMVPSVVGALDATDGA